MKPLVIFSFLIVSMVPVYADGIHPQGIKLDGTLGSAGNLGLPGPDYDIKAEFGKQAGANLFHSFEQFNIHKGESATFTGPDSVQNIISRVTGGNASWIDGKLASTIPNADLYFLNSAGLMFGPNASLDLSGSFHISTADYLRLGENERFYAISSENDVLSAAAPSAFGFLNDSPSPISVKESFLRLSEEKTLSLVGGDIRIEDGTLYVPGGDIAMFSAASAQEVIPKDSATDTESRRLGNIHISDSSSEPFEMDGVAVGNIDVSSDAGGSIFIRGGQFVSDHADIFSNTYGNTDSKGQIDISAGETVSLMNGTVISAMTFGSGNAGSVSVTADELNLSGGSGITADSNGSGTGGNISVFAEKSVSASGIETFPDYFVSGGFFSFGYDEGDAGEILLKTRGELKIGDGAFIGAPTYGKGRGGLLEISAGSVSVEGGAEFSGDFYPSGLINSTFGEGDAGDIVMTVAGDINLTQGATVNVSSYGAGNGGRLEISAGSVFASGSFADCASGFFSTAQGEGDAGDILLNVANEVTLREGASLTVGTLGSGKGGKMEINAKSLSLSGTGEIPATSVSSSTHGQGNAGDMVLNITDELSLTDGGVISATTHSTGNSGELKIAAGSVFTAGGIISDGMYYLSSGINSSTYGDGNAGDIFMTVAGPLILKDGGGILAGTDSNGDGADINISAESASFSGAMGSSEYFSPSGIFSRTYADGNAGDIFLNVSEALEMTDGAEIGASGWGKGQGGTMRLSARSVFLSGGSRGGGDFNPTAIASDAWNEGKAGDISLNASETLTMKEHARISVNSRSSSGGILGITGGSSIYLLESEISSNVRQGEGKGGDIAADSESLILNDSKITANAQDGDGGAVFIRSDNFIRSSDSRVTATSQRGNQGTVKIQAPDLDIAGSLTVMPGNFLDAAKWAVTPCRYRSAENLSRFVFQGRYAVPLSFEDWQPSPVMPADDKRDNSGPEP